MKRFIAISTNENPVYLFHTLLTCWAWNKIGWEPIVFYHGDLNHALLNVICEHSINPEISFHIIPVRNISDFQSETIAQCSRLYAACLTDGYIMTGDADMIPLSDYWKPDENKLTVYGRDLTDYHYPICYIGMDSEKWKEVMNIDGNDYQYYMQRDLMTLPQAKSQDKVKRWVTDQDLITDRINASNFVPERIDRGTDKRTGYPIGRVDRSHWTLNHEVFIDAHLPHDILTNDASFKNVMALLHHVWPKEDWRWFVNYYKDFKKMTR